MPRSPGFTPRKPSDLCHPGGDGAAESTAPLSVGFLPFWVENPYQEKLSQELEPLGVTVSRLGRSGASVMSRLLRDRPQIIHLHWLDPLYDSPNIVMSLLKLVGSISVLSLLRLTGTKIVWTAHNLKKHENKQSRIDRFCTAFIAKYAHAVIAHCDSAKARIIAEFGLKDEGRIHVIPHGNYHDVYENNIDPDSARKILNLPPDHLVFLFLGRVRPYKGVLELIHAFRREAATDAILVIAGKPLSDQSEREIEQAIALDSRIRFSPGFVSNEDIQVYMNACDIVVLPYRDVFTSGAAVLAMSFDRACIAPELGCMTDWFQDDGAILYPADDPDGLQKSIGEATSGRAHLADMGRRNGRLASQWSWTHVASETNGVYRFVIRSKSSSPANDQDAARQ